MTACNGAGGPRASRKNHRRNPQGVSHSFWLTVKLERDAAGKDLNVKIVWKGAAQETDYSGQINIVEDMINQRVDGHRARPVARRFAGADGRTRANRRHPGDDLRLRHLDGEIPLIRLDRQPQWRSRARRSRMGEKLGGKGKVAILGVKKGSVSTDEREEGFRDTIRKEFPGIDARPDHLLRRGQRDEIVVCRRRPAHLAFRSGRASSRRTNRPPWAAVRAVQERNLAGKVTLVGFDATADLVRNVREGAIDSLVLQNPFKMGYEGVKTVVDKIGGKQPERRIDTGVALLTKDNVDTPDNQKLIK